MRVGPQIDYRLIADAMTFYTALGYQPVEVPWVVSDEVSELTCPDTKLAFGVSKYDTHVGKLIGSSEQALISAVCSGALPSGKKLVCCSPCFRVNQDDSPYHFDQFMKIELGFGYPLAKYKDLETVSVRMPNMISIIRLFIHHARSFFESKTSSKVETYNSDTDPETDILVNDIEVGSYGWRLIPNNGNPFIWCYGTGLALPRFTQAAGINPRIVSVSNGDDDILSPSRL